MKGKARFDDWYAEIASADVASKVVEVMARFIDSLDAVEIHALPPECRPDQIKAPRDVSNCAFILATASFSQQDPATFLFLKDVSLVFAEASTRIATLAIGRDRLPLRQRLREDS